MIGQALTDHNDVRKVGFTGSTEVGKTIMKWLVKISHVVNVSKLLLCFSVVL